MQASITALRRSNSATPREKLSAAPAELQFCGTRSKQRPNSSPLSQLYASRRKNSSNRNLNPCDSKKFPDPERECHSDCTSDNDADYCPRFIGITNMSA